MPRHRGNRTPSPRLKQFYMKAAAQSSLHSAETAKSRRWSHFPPPPQPQPKHGMLTSNKLTPKSSSHQPAKPNPKAATRNPKCSIFVTQCSHIHSYRKPFTKSYEVCKPTRLRPMALRWPDHATRTEFSSASALRQRVREVEFGVNRSFEEARMYMSMT